MNEALHIQELALGIEPIDAGHRRRLVRALDIVFGFAEPDMRERIPRHASRVYALIRRPGLDKPLFLRFEDETRRFVPRRLTLTLSSTQPTILRPIFFPGAAYDVHPRATGLRGQVLRTEQPVRWIRAEARLPAAAPGTGPVVGFAHGDDRGEFLLLLGAEAGPQGPLVSFSLKVEISLFEPLPIAPPPASAAPDPFWDLPVEPVSIDDPANPTDPHLGGTELLPGYGEAPVHRATVTLSLGELRSTTFTLS